MTDKEKIINYLKRIEDEYNVQILYAVESGSRSWGTHHSGSDYDVKFIYVKILIEIGTFNFIQKEM